jgi:hypothetical protein
MSQFNSAERKEVGSVGGTTSGDPLFTSEELDLILGPVSPGLHLGDEVRISGRLTNYNPAPLVDVEIFDTFDKRIEERAVLKQGIKVVFLDVRQRVTAEDLVRKSVVISLGYRAKIHNLRQVEMQQVTGRSVITLSTVTGLPINL